MRKLNIIEGGKQMVNKTPQDLFYTTLEVLIDSVANEMTEIAQENDIDRAVVEEEIKRLKNELMEVER